MADQRVQKMSPERLEALLKQLCPDGLPESIDLDPGTIRDVVKMIVEDERLLEVEVAMVMKHILTGLFNKVIAQLDEIIPSAALNVQGMKVVVRARGDNYHACIEGEPGKWECGKTSAEAVGKLIKAHAARFNIQIEQLHRAPGMETRR